MSHLTNSKTEVLIAAALEESNGVLYEALAAAAGLGAALARFDNALDKLRAHNAPQTTGRRPSEEAVA